MVLLNEKVSYESVQEIGKKYQIDRLYLRNILGISESTQFRYEKKNPILKDNLADRWARFVKVLNLAEDLFADEGEIQRWFSTPKIALSDRTPLEILDTDAGTRLVEEMLLQASYGVFA